MKRAFVVVLGLLAVVLLVAPLATAQRVRVPGVRRSTGGSSGSVASYLVLIEKTGIEIYCGLYNSMEQVMARANLVKLENETRREDNDELDSQIKKIREQIATKARELEKAEEDGLKAQLAKEIEDLKGQIAGKETERKTLIKLAGPKKFSTRKRAEKFMEAKYAACDKEKEKIEDAVRDRERKERENKRKAAEDAKKKAAAAEVKEKAAKDAADKNDDA